MDDLISRQAAIRALCKAVHKDDDTIPCDNQTVSCLWSKTRVCDFAREIYRVPPAQPERLTDDDFETIRIHLNAFKENLCNQQRWGEAEEYQRIIDRFIAFASAQPEIIRCKDCKHRDVDGFCKGRGWPIQLVPDDGFCDKGKRSEE